MKNKTKKIKVGEEEFVEVEWDDAYHLTESWLSVDQIAQAYKEERYRVFNVGWLIFEDKDYIILASKRSKDFREWGFVMMIPKGMIINTKALKDKK